LCARTLDLALAVGIGTSPPVCVDGQGIVAACRAAMLAAVRGLQVRPDLLLVDAVALPDAGIPYQAPTKADDTYLCVAVASIVAKVTRDRLLGELEARYPGYSLASNKGYGTPAHMRALLRLGITPLHRRSFAPVKYLTGVLDHAPALPAPGSGPAEVHTDLHQAP
jgi:ribonuclease HII